jgi:hypothetical protein
VRNSKALTVASDRYRLHVAAFNVVDLITWAGGWLADRAMAGWDVEAFIADHHDDRPLHILGVERADLASLHSRDPRAPRALAVASDLCQADKRVDARLRQAVARGEPEVIVVGNSYPQDLRRRPVTVEHQCSGAAMAFKGRALAAAGGSNTALTDREVLYSWPAARAQPADHAPRWPTQGAARQLQVAASMGRPGAGRRLF